AHRPIGDTTAGRALVRRHLSLGCATGSVDDLRVVAASLEGLALTLGQAGDLVRVRVRRVTTVRVRGRQVVALAVRVPKEARVGAEELARLDRAVLAAWRVDHADIARARTCDRRGLDRPAVSVRDLRLHDRIEEPLTHVKRPRGLR